MRWQIHVRLRRLAFALKEVRDSEKSMLDIAFDYGFSSHEVFTRAFKGTYGVTPSEYRKNPKPVVLRIKINPFDRYFLGFGEIGMMKSMDDVKIYFVTVPTPMLMIDVPEAEYIVFDQGSFDYEQENRSVEEKVEKAMAAFDYAGTGYCADTSPGRIIYFYHNPERFFKYIRPVRKS